MFWCAVLGNNLLLYKYFVVLVYDTKLFSKRITKPNTPTLVYETPMLTPRIVLLILVIASGYSPIVYYDFNFYAISYLFYHIFLSITLEVNLL